MSRVASARRRPGSSHVVVRRYAESRVTDEDDDEGDDDHTGLRMRRGPGSTRAVGGPTWAVPPATTSERPPCQGLPGPGILARARGAGRGRRPDAPRLQPQPQPLGQVISPPADPQKRVLQRGVLPGLRAPVAV